MSEKSGELLEKTLSPEEWRTERLEAERASFRMVSLEKIQVEESQKVLEKTEIHASLFADKSLTTQDLREKRLIPENKIQIGDQLVWFSSAPYEIKHDRIAVVAYVETEGAVVARSFYLSSSQGTWRYLPEYAPDDEGGISWFSKGWAEESVTLPFVLQKALAQISGAKDPLVEVEDASFVFAGTARKKEPMPHAPATYFLEVGAKPELIKGNLHQSKVEEGAKTPPEQLSMSEKKKEPDFTALIDTWAQYSRLYGEVKVSIFPSNDFSLRYMICQDWRGRTWISGIENNSSIESTGLRKSWVDGGDLTTPAYEYQFPGVDQTGGYGNPSLRKGLYVDMYETYLKKTPLIQNYLKQFPLAMEDDDEEEAEREESMTETMSIKDRISVVMDVVSADKRIRGFVAELAGVGFDARERVDRAMVEKVLARYSDAKALDQGLLQFLERVEKGSGFDKRLQYEKSLKQFLDVAYSDRIANV